jgi:hypothetical protein
VAWVLGRSRISKESGTIDYLNKRLDFLERLNKLHTQLAEGPIKPFLDTEIEHFRAFLLQPPTFIPHGAEVEVAAPQSRWARFFLLTQPAVSVRKRIFKGLFFFFFLIAMLNLPLVIVIFSEQPSSEKFAVVGVMFFPFFSTLALPLCFAARHVNRQLAHHCMSADWHCADIVRCPFDAAAALDRPE